MSVVLDLTGETSDSDADHKEISQPTQFNTVTPNKPRKGNVQTTIENAISRGFSSGIVQVKKSIIRDNWDTHNKLCDSTFIYHANNSFAAPAYDTTTISPTLPIRNSHVIKLPLFSCDNKEVTSVDTTLTDLSCGKHCTNIEDKESASDILSKGMSNTNDVTPPNTTICLYVANDDNHFMNAYLSRN